MLARREAEGHRIGAEKRLPTAVGHRRLVRVGHDDADHVPCRGHFREVGQRSAVAAVHRSDHADPVLFRQIQRRFHGPAGRHVSEAVVAVDDGGDRAGAAHADLRHGVDASGGEFVYIMLHPQNAVGIHAPQIGMDQHIGGDFRMVFGHSGAGQFARAPIPQLIRSHPHEFHPIHPP